VSQVLPGMLNDANTTRLRPRPIVEATAEVEKYSTRPRSELVAKAEAKAETLSKELPLRISIKTYIVT